MTIDDAILAPQRNNLTLVRLVLASAVIWTHSVWRVTGVMGVDEFSPILGQPVSVFAVDGFFFLSGFLVYASLMRRGSVVDFLVARFARLWPALAVAVLATVAVGWFITVAPGLSYFGGQTARFLLGNLSLTIGSYYLTGIECGPELCKVNGSLWTIPWEVRCYLLLALLLPLGLARPWAMKRIVLPATLAFTIAMHVPAVVDQIDRHAPDAVLYYARFIDRLWSMFALGIAAYIWRDRITLRWSVLLLLILAVVVSNWLALTPHLRRVVTAYAVLCGGFLTARRVAMSGRWPDYSYGIYIYAFPVMMAVAAIFPFGHHLPLAAVNLVLTVPLAALSWHLVEKPVLDLVRHRRSRASKASLTDTITGRIATGRRTVTPDERKTLSPF